MICVMLGAGFSKWAADLPLAKELFDFKVTPWGIQESKKLDLVKRIKSQWDSSHPGGLAEQFIADVLQGPVRQSTAVLWYVVRRLSEPYIWEEWHAGRRRRHVLMIDEHRASERPGVRETRILLDSLPSSTMSGIITTNYDMLVEYALGSRGFNYGIAGEVLSGRGPYPVSQYLRPTTLTGLTSYITLHGSISWDEQGRYTDGRRGLSGQALIVPPAPGKPAPSSLADVWVTAGEILGRSRRILVFGFAFNPYDASVLDLLRQEGRGIRSVLLVDPFPPVKSAQSLWPAAKVMSCSPLSPAAMTSISKWIVTP